MLSGLCSRTGRSVKVNDTAGPATISTRHLALFIIIKCFRGRPWSPTVRFVLTFAVEHTAEDEKDVIKTSGMRLPVLFEYTQFGINVLKHLRKNSTEGVRLPQSPEQPPANISPILPLQVNRIRGQGLLNDLSLRLPCLCKG